MGSRQERKREAMSIIKGKDVVGAFRTVLDEQNRDFEVASQSPYYHYTLQEPSQEESTELLYKAYIHGFFRAMVGRVKDFRDTQFSLRRVGVQLHEEGLDTQTITEDASTIVNNGYNLVKNLQTLTEAPATVPQVSAIMTNQQKLEFKEIVDQMGKEKPKGFTATLRRYIPRWMTHPIAFPDALASSDPMTHDVWHSHSLKDANWLTSEEDMLDGKIPVHLVFSAAQKLEKEEKTDAAYPLRTYAIEHLLAIEQEKLVSENPEIPFFTYALAGLMTGEMQKQTKAPFFDFQTAINHTMQQTFIRLEDELTTGKKGPAFNFLSNLASNYQDAFSDLLARSLASQGRKVDAIDELTLLRQLQIQSDSWAMGVIEQSEQLIARRTLFADEVIDLNERLANDPQGDFVSEVLIDDLTLLLDSEDVYSFKPRLQKLVPTGDVRGEIKIDLDKTAELVEVELKYESEGRTRYLPFRFSFSGEIDSVSMETLEGEITDGDLLATYRNLVAQAINQQAEQIRSRKKPDIRQKSDLDTDQDEERITVSSLTREERIALYARQKEQLKRKRTRPKIEPAGVIFTEQEEIQEKTPTKPTIIGLDTETITELLTTEKIEGIEAEDIKQKLERVLDMSVISKKAIGKKVNMDTYGKDTKHAGINIRQINWILDGGATALRIYLEDIGKGKFVLRGILRKKGSDMQTRYIGQMIDHILKERSAHGSIVQTTI